MNIKLKWALGASLAGAAYLLLKALFLEKYFFSIKKYKIGSRHGSKTLKLVLITDLHIKRHYWPYYAKLARAINRLSPDLLLIAGDTLDGNTKIEVVDTFFGQLDAQIPKVAIMGNHDYKDKLDTEALARLYSKHQGRLLQNETITYTLKGEALTVTGLNDFIEGDACFLEAVEGVGRKEHHVLLIHSPLQQEPVLARLHEQNKSSKDDQKINISYIFAGHNHGGQVRLGKLVPVLPTMSGPYINGWYNSEKPYLYLSKGFGTSSLPFRFGARAELTVFEYGV